MNLSFSLIDSSSSSESDECPALGRVDPMENFKEKKVVTVCYYCNATILFKFRRTGSVVSNMTIM